MGHRMLPIAFSLTDPRCYANEIWDKIGYNLACVKDICEICAPIGKGGFEDKPLNAANCIFSDRHPLPWNKIWDKTRGSVYEISARFLRL